MERQPTDNILAHFRSYIHYRRMAVVPLDRLPEYHHHLMALTDRHRNYHRGTVSDNESRFLHPEAVQSHSTTNHLLLLHTDLRSRLTAYSLLRHSRNMQGYSPQP
jgi:hypothetical protein